MIWFIFQCVYNYVWNQYLQKNIGFFYCNISLESLNELGNPGDVPANCISRTLVTSDILPAMRMTDGQQAAGGEILK